MVIVKMTAYSDYCLTWYSQIANVMELKWYKQLMCCLHFCNNEDTDDTIATDRIFKGNFNNFTYSNQKIFYWWDYGIDYCLKRQKSRLKTTIHEK